MYSSRNDHDGRTTVEQTMEETTMMELHGSERWNEWLKSSLSLAAVTTIVEASCGVCHCGSHCDVAYVEIDCGVCPSCRGTLWDSSYVVDRAVGFIVCSVGFIPGTVHWPRTVYWESESLTEWDWKATSPWRYDDRFYDRSEDRNVEDRKGGLQWSLMERSKPWWL